MAADVALNRDLTAAYPFCRLTGPANVLIMRRSIPPISTKMLQELGGATVIGPLLVGLDMPVQIVHLTATDSDLVNMAALAPITSADNGIGISIRDQERQMAWSLILILDPDT